MLINNLSILQKRCLSLRMMRYIGNTPKLPEFGKIKSEKLTNVSFYVTENNLN